MFPDDLTSAARAFGVAFDDRQAAQFERFYRLVLDWNQRMNLTTITEPNDFAIKHIIDSLMILRAEPALDGRRVIDVGTGAGFPGLPLKIFCPSIRLTLLDSLNKRINFLTAAIEALELEGVDCIHARAEDAARSELREAFDVVVARAVARLNVLTEYCLPFSRVGGKFIALKGSSVAEELDEARAAIKILGGRSLAPIDVTLPNGDPRSIVVIEKRTSTPIHFPRRAGIPDRKPLSNTLLTGVRRLNQRTLEKAELLSDVAELVSGIAGD